MSEGRNRFRNHVRAAREWLGQAETSLDKEEDIRGDLNVMLAQAELQRAKETKELTRAQRWLHRLVPIAAAFLLVAGCLAFLRWEQPQSTAPAPAAMPAAAPAELTPAAVPSAVAAAARAEAAARPASVAAEPVEVPLPAAGTPAVQTPAAPVVTEKTGEQQVYMPSENLQKLMCSAGKSLRAQ